MRRRRFMAISAMTDIAFLLLLFFLLFSLASHRVPIGVDLAASESSSPLQEPGLVLSIDSDGLLYLDGQEATLAQVPYHQIVSIHADRHTPFAKILPIMQRLQQLEVPIVQCVVETK